MRTILVVLLSAAFSLALAAAAFQLAGSQPPVALPAAVADALARSGVDNPVTAVLLNFRSYDTLLEVAVLVIAALTALSLGRARAVAVPSGRSGDVLLHALLRWFVPLMLVLAAYLVWVGAHRPGGAFQAGAVIAGAGVLMRLAGIPLPLLAAGPTLRVGLMLGLAVFLAAALLGAVTTGTFLAYPEPLAGAIILVVEIFLALSIATILLELFVSGPPSGGEGAPPPAGDEA